MLNSLRRLWKDEQAASSVEYALLLMGIAAVIIGAVELLGTKVNNQFETANNLFPE